jgi:hypothetical protein
VAVPGLTGAARVAAEARVAPVIVIVAYVLLLALIVLRRFRHMIVLWVNRLWEARLSDAA